MDKLPLSTFQREMGLSLILLAPLKENLLVPLKEPKKVKYRKAKKEY